MNGVQCCPPGCSTEPSWKQQRPIPFQMFGQGEYVGPARAAHTPEYRIRVDDRFNSSIASRSMSFRNLMNCR